ncbi:MAG: trypsin-like peptidase domain-containing protein [Nitrososphaera sp.]
MNKAIPVAAAIVIVAVAVFAAAQYYVPGTTSLLKRINPQVPQLLTRQENSSTDNSSASTGTQLSVPSTAPSNTPASSQPTPSGTDSSALNPKANSDLISLFKHVNNSVVQITSKVTSSNPNIIINGNPLQGQSERLGSGFVYDSAGHIVTNNHVVDGTNSVDITFVDGNTYTAKVIGTDKYSDIAVLQIDDTAYNSSSENSPALPIGNSSALEVGQQVIAIGNPFGLSDTMTTGIVSQVGRLLPNQDIGFSIPNVIQTDAAINPGNSGGPLLNTNGEVVGMNTAIQSNTGDFSGIGFAIPSNSIQRIVAVLIKDGTYNHPWVGIAGTNMTPEIANSLGLPHNTKGAVVAQVVPNGPAAKAGIRSATTSSDDTQKIKNADIITAVDGQQVKRIEDVIFYIEEHKVVGDTAHFTILRDGKSIEIPVTLGTRPQANTTG